MMKQNEYTYYQYLGVEKNATMSEIKSAFRKCAKSYHPDANPAPNAAVFFQKVHEAYSVLSDTGKRQAYDRSLSSPTMNSESTKKDSTRKDSHNKTKNQQGDFSGFYNQTTETERNKASKKRSKAMDVSSLRSSLLIKVLLLPVKFFLWIFSIAIGFVVFFFQFILSNFVTRIILGFICFLSTMMVIMGIVFLFQGESIGGAVTIMIVGLSLFWVSSRHGTIFITEKVLVPLAIKGKQIKAFGKSL